MTRSLSLGLLAAVFMSTSALADGVQTRTFTFENEGSKLTGTLYLPDDYKAGEKLATVIVTGSWTSVEQQMPRGYAEEMAERGFAAVTFDFRGWGGSGDLPNRVRYKEDPQAKISDIKAAASAIAALPEVDPAKITGLGICASAGYMVDAAIGNDAIKAVGLVAPWLQNKEIVSDVYGGEAGVAALIDTSRKAEAAGGQIIKAAGPEGAKDTLMPIGGYYYEPMRGAIPEYDNKWNNASWESWLTYYPADSAARLDKPLAVVHSEAAAIPQGVKTFLASYSGEATAQWLDKVTQFDFYDNKAAMDTASDTMAAHFRNSLSQ